MKAKTKAAKLKAKRGGRPRKEGAPRELSGRVDRKWSAAKTSEDVMRAGVSARMRLHGLTDEQARSQEGGSVIGRLLIGKEISVDQARAAERYSEVRNAYQRAIGATPESGTPPPPPLFESGGGSFEAFCESAKAAQRALQNCLQSIVAEARSYNPIAALDVFITRDTFAAHLLGDLRIALNALHRHFTQERRRTV